MEKLDSSSEAYLFGSAAEGRYTHSSDIDILILTDVGPSIIHEELWKAGIADPFEIHVQPRKYLSIYQRKSRLIKIKWYISGISITFLFLIV